MAPADHDIVEAPRPVFSAWIGVVLLFVVFGLFVWVVMGVSPRTDNYEEKRAKARTEKLTTTRDEATAALTTYGYVDKAKGVVHVPINRAMQLTMAELAQKKPAPANPIASPAGPSTATQTGAAAASPASISTPQPGASATPKASSIAGPKSENRGQPAAAANPPNAQPGTQPGANATPAASPPAGAAQPNVAPSASTTPMQEPAGTPLPVAGATP